MSLNLTQITSTTTTSTSLEFYPKLEYRTFIDISSHLQHTGIMKLAISLGLAAVVSANIVFNHVPLHCGPDNPQIYHGCLRGQQCRENGT